MPETMWAPWRLEYVERTDVGTQHSTDIFLKLPQEQNDEKNLILFRGVTGFVMLNAFPYSNGHLLVAPYRQVCELEELNDEELLEINKLTASAIIWLKKVYQPNGFNVGVNLGRAGGAGIPVHIHWHVVPRWNGDTNFMTTVADTRVIPESLASTYEKLSTALRDG